MNNFQENPFEPATRGNVKNAKYMTQSPGSRHNGFITAVDSFEDEAVEELPINHRPQKTERNVDG